MRAAVVCILVTGCFAKPGPPGMQTDRDASTGSDADAAKQDAPPTHLDAGGLCVIDEGFLSSGPACGTWGTETGPTMLRTNDKIHATPTASGTAACTTVELQPSGTITIHLDVVGNTSDNNYALFDLTTATGKATLNVYRAAGSDNVNVSCGNILQPAQPYSATTHRYLRYAMEPFGDDLRVRVLSSHDPTDDTFTNQLGSCTFLAGALGPVTVTFGSATDPGATSPPTSAWDELHYSCQ